MPIRESDTSIKLMSLIESRLPILMIGVTSIPNTRLRWILPWRTHFRRFANAFAVYRATASECWSWLRFYKK